MAQISRKELKSDEFVSGMDAALEFYLQHQRAVITAAVVLVVVVASGYGYVSWSRNRNRAAAAMLAQALNTMHASVQTTPASAAPAANSPVGGVTYPSTAARGSAAAQQFQAVINRYGSTSAGQLAHYYLGLAQLDDNDAHATQTLQAAAQSSDAVAATAAQHALANLDIQQGKLADAHKLLEALTKQDSSTLPRAVAMLELASLDRTYNPKEAAQLYKQLQADYPSTATAQQAQQDLASLGTGQ
ncbi:MAG TPA: hypothetical protein VIC54_00775 [Terriglobales bacterium]